MNSTQMINPFSVDFQGTLPKALMSGATYAAGTMVVFPDDIGAMVRLPIVEIEVPMIALSFAAGIVGSIGGDLAAAALYPLIPLEERVKNGSIMLTDALLSGAVECVVLKLLAGIPMESFPKLLAFSASHNMANEYAWANILGAPGYNIV